MTEKDHPMDDGWDRGWDEHKKRQLQRIARLPMAAKLEWLEQAQKLAEETISQSRRQSKQTDPDQ